MMVQEMDATLKRGGVVDSVYSNAKIGGALLIENINGNSWSRDLAEAYRQELMGRGWVERRSDEDSVVLCKGDMVAKIKLSPERDSSQGLPREVYGFSMVFNVMTMKVCN
ncbi:hypothetical protein C0Z17_05250 [Trinickia caryophylli]|nr:hypothetical protein C0Z17_05250 [Trinickia caryophylli]